MVEQGVRDKFGMTISYTSDGHGGILQSTSSSVVIERKISVALTHFESWRFRRRAQDHINPTNATSTESATGTGVGLSQVRELLTPDNIIKQLHIILLHSFAATDLLTHTHIHTHTHTRARDDMYTVRTRAQ